MSNCEFLTFDSSETFVFPSLEDFIEWLEVMEPDEIVSTNWTRHGCPIWMFLKSFGWENPTVYGHGFWHPMPQAEVIEDYRLPSWAAEFSWWEDRLVERSLTAGQCLNLIRNSVFDPSRWENGNSRPSLGRVIGF